MTKKITALKVQKRNKNRVNVFLDGEFAFGLTRIVASWLQVGQELSDEKIKDLQSKDEVEIALQRALRYLSYRPRSEKEVRQNLNKHDFSDTVVDEIIQRLKRNQLVDDTAFARMWVENRSEFRPRGAYALRMELRQKGLPDGEIDQALSDLNEEQLALKAARKQVRKYRGLEQQDFRNKMSGFLARRGFNYAIISSIIPTLWEEQKHSLEDHQPQNEV